MDSQLRRRLAHLALGLFSIAMPFSGARATATLYMTGVGQTAISGLYTVNTATGAATYVGHVRDAGGDIYVNNGGLAYDPVDRILYASGVSYHAVSMLYTINPVTAAATPVGPSGGTVSLGTSGLAFDLVSRKLYATGQESTLGQHTGLFELNKTTGAASLIGPTVQAGAYLYNLGMDPVSGVLYANGRGSFVATQSELLVLNKTNGAEAVVGSHGITLGRQMWYGGLAFHPDTRVCYGIGSITASTSGLYTVDTSTGAATLVGGFGITNGADGGLAFIPTPTGVDRPVRVGAAGLSAWPNPFGRETTLSYSLGATASVELAVYDVTGRRVARLLHGTQPSGSHRITAGDLDVPAGVYFVRLIIDGRVSESVKLVRLRH